VNHSSEGNVYFFQNSWGGRPQNCQNRNDGSLGFLVTGHQQTCKELIALKKPGSRAQTPPFEESQRDKGKKVKVWAEVRQVFVEARVEFKERGEHSLITG